MKTVPVIKWANTPLGEIPIVDTALTFNDRLGFLKMRFAVGRMDYALSPGLYGIGSPLPESPVFVTSNYRMTFDILRSNLSGIDSWILVLDTRGINVWCAAGEGYFGTEELLKRIDSVGLSRVVSHRILILPQLGAPGISAHEVRGKSGFTVVYGPIEARDIPSFLKRGMEATEKMRRVTFAMDQRISLVPVELVTAARYLVPAAIFFLLLSGFSKGEFHLVRIMRPGVLNMFLFSLGVLAGAVVVPLFLPWIPSRLFSVKGALLGILFTAIFGFFLGDYHRMYGSWFSGISWFLIIPSLGSVMAMNFTGSTTFTSLSGVKKEISLSLLPQIVVMAGGLILWIAGMFA
jgi:acetyl-CoA decarbonylase/synthase complex subunit gamma